MSPAHKPHQTMSFSGCIHSFCNASGWSSLQSRQFCLFTYPLSQKKAWSLKQFFDKEQDLQPTFQEPIHRKFCIAVGRSWEARPLSWLKGFNGQLCMYVCMVGRSASIFAPAVFWKVSHLNPSTKCSTLLSNRGPIAANVDESIIDGYH